MARRETAVARARELRGRSTDAEAQLWKRLRDRRFHGLKFRRQYVVGPFIVDFCCPNEALIVELDGGQHDQDRARDAERTAYLRALGYRVLRFWNNELLQHEGAALRRLAQVLGIDEEIPSPRLRGEG
jgi:very-short-patch-repair endonuclease